MRLQIAESISFYFYNLAIANNMKYNSQRLFVTVYNDDSENEFDEKTLLPVFLSL